MGPMNEWNTAYRDLGFRGPDRAGRMSATVAGLDLGAVRGPSEIIIVTARWSSEREIGFGSVTCASSWDARRVLNAIEQHLDAPELRSALAELRLRCGTTLADAELITEAAMTTGNFTQFNIDLLPKLTGARYGFDQTLEYRSALWCARESDDALLVGWLATDHPGQEIRCTALLNPACPEAAKLAVAAEGDDLRTLLHDRNLSEAVFGQIVASAAARYLESERPSLQHDLLLAMALHLMCPAHLVPGLVAHLVGRSITRRIGLARQAWTAAPERRDAIHAVLLQRSRPGAHTDELLWAVLGQDGHAAEERIRWLDCHADARVHRFTDRARAVRGRALTVDSPKESRR